MLYKFTSAKTRTNLFICKLYFINIYNNTSKTAEMKIKALFSEDIGNPEQPRAFLPESSVTALMMEFHR